MDFPNVAVTSADAASQGKLPDVDDKYGAILDLIDIEGVRALHCVLMNIQEDPGVLRHHLRAFTWNDLHGPWLDKFPQDVIAALSTLKKEQYRQIGKEWWERVWEEEEPQALEELLLQMPIDKLVRDITTLVRMAAIAVGEGKNMYWVVPRASAS